MSICHGFILYEILPLFIVGKYKIMLQLELHAPDQYFSYINNLFIYISYYLILPQTEYNNL